jgi:hypothetical protein
MAFYVYKVASGVIKLVAFARSFGEESLLFSHLLEERKAERGLQLRFRDIELLLLYRST